MVETVNEIHSLKRTPDTDTPFSQRSLNRPETAVESRRWRAAIDAGENVSWWLLSSANARTCFPGGAELGRGRVTCSDQCNAVECGTHVLLGQSFESPRVDGHPSLQFQTPQGALPPLGFRGQQSHQRPRGPCGGGAVVGSHHRVSVTAAELRLSGLDPPAPLTSFFPGS